MTRILTVIQFMLFRFLQFNLYPLLSVYVCMLSFRQIYYLYSSMCPLPQSIFLVFPTPRCFLFSFITTPFLSFIPCLTLATSNLFFISKILSFQDCNINGIILGMGFCVLIIFHGDGSWLCVLIIHSSTSLTSISWCRCTTDGLTIHLLKDIWVVSCLGLLWIKLPWT